jgi:uncharacterized repeat protein (TIGR02543 family)
MRIWGIFGAAAARRIQAIVRSPNASLALWCFVLLAVSAGGIAVRAEAGSAQAAERAADTPSDGTGTGGGSTGGGTGGTGGGTNPSDLNSGAATYTLTLATTGTATGTIGANPATGPVYSSGSTVVLTAQPTAGGVFAGWSGDCTGTQVTCSVVMTANKTVTATFNIKITKLNVTTLGGTVSAPASRVSTGPFSCQDTCAWSYPSGVTNTATLTATPATGYIFKSWGGICSGTAPTCSASFSADAAVSAVFVPILKVGAVFSTAQLSSKSFLRFFNTGSTSGSAAVTLYNPATGAALGTWTTPTIAAGTAPQFFIGDVELGAGLTAGAAKPDFYSLSIQTTMSGYFQHVLWRADNNTLTNLSTCGTGVTADGARVSNVHASVFDKDYPSTVVVTNTGTAPADVTLGVYDSATAARLGSYTMLSVPAQGRVSVLTSQIEGAAGITASTTVPHYTVKIESPQFTGFLQHLVNNKAASVVTDMTTVCALDGAAARTLPPITTPSLMFSTTQGQSQSFIRLSNVGTTAGTVVVRLYDSSSGRQLATWTSPSIPGGAEQQFSIGDIEKALPDGAAKPDYYGMEVEPQFWGGFQHVLWQPVKATLTNLSTCPANVTASPAALTGVHSSLLNALYPSQVVINNTGATALNGPLLGIYDARDGTKLGVYSVDNIAPNTHALVSVSAIEAQVKITPSDGMYHYVIKAEAPFSGFLQHLLNNTTAGMITDMSTYCILRGAGPPPS